MIELLRRCRAVLAAVILILLPSPSAACSCMWMGGFLKVAPNAPVIVHVRVLDYHGRNRKVDLAMDVEVAEVLRGEVATKQLRIWGDNGAMCRPYVSGFHRGTEWVLAINPISRTAADPGSRPGDFFINGCGAYWLRVDNGRVRGHMTEGSPGNPEQTMTLDELRAALKKP